MIFCDFFSFNFVAFSFHMRTENGANIYSERVVKMGSRGKYTLDIN